MARPGGDDVSARPPVNRRMTVRGAPGFEAALFVPSGVMGNESPSRILRSRQ